VLTGKTLASTPRVLQSGVDEGESGLTCLPVGSASEGPSVAHEGTGEAEERTHIPPLGP